MSHLVIAAAVGFGVGLACPGVIRVLRAKLFGEVAKVETDAKAGASAVAKKL